ncbi:MAG: DUF342 domain-containing protein [Planctomycetes bacterium]|nr:DUF342 domain-containing protein [Planctomycetota bacterium]
MARIRIQVTAGGLVATAEVGKGPAATAAELQQALATAQVREGLDAAAVDRLAASLADPEYSGRVVVANGTPSRPGSDCHVDGLPSREPLVGTTRPDGSIDWREREFLHPVAAGQVLAQVVEATAGEPGRAVTGAAVPVRAGKSCSFRLGAGAARDGERVVAVRDGALSYDGRTIDVLPLFVHGADVDVASGNLHTKGSLVVRGDVTQDHAASADGDLHVTGAVLDGRVHAGGSVRIDQGVMGEHASVVAGHDVVVRHATSARLQAGATLTIADQATHCRMQTSTLLARTGRGAVFGGEVHAKSTIAVRIAGTANGAATRLCVADVSDLAAASVRATNVDQRTAALATRRSEGSARDGKILRQGLRAADQALAERLALQHARRELLAGATIEIDETVHPGVVLVFGETRLAITEPRRHVRFRWCQDTATILEEPKP